ncbi:MAG: glucose-6-phosphate dehydrogenase assembly protein OpcA [Armatimonadetes bacterium]|nr:glucose-6-phosphate dehydrogenase assembly protein OpcA [Armatimonadota bacterium]
MNSDIYALTEPRPVDLAAIERELEHLWQDTDSPASGEPGVSRITLLNLVACTQEVERASEIAQEIASVTLYHPCRAIIVAIGPEEGDAGLDASVAAYCHIPESGPRPICCEQITLRVRGESVGRLSAILPPLLVPDLPRFLWWLDTPDFDRPYFRRLAGGFDRLIVDSRRFARNEDLLRMIEWHDDILVSDLNWLRLTPWQELIAEFFDPEPFRPYLSTVEKVAVTFACRKGVCEAQAFLLIGWLSARLGWQPETLESPEAGCRIAMHRDGQAIEVLLQGQPEEDASGGDLISVRIEAGGDSPAAFEIVRVEGGSLAAVSVEMAGACPLPYRTPIGSESTTGLLCEDLETLGRNSLFEEALHKIEEILSKTNSKEK